jgi:hypothetical protein
MLLSAVSLLVVALPSSEAPEGLMNLPVAHIHDISGHGYDTAVFTCIFQLLREEISHDHHFSLLY